MRTVIVLALLIAFLPTATWAGNCHSCGKCKSACTACKPACQPKCDTCKPRCDSCKPKCDTCKPKCDSCKPACKPACEPKCGGCKSCQPACKPACEPKCGGCKSCGCQSACKPKCGGCKSCGSCQSACKPACGPAPCNTCGKSTCGGGCGTSSCGSCAPPCACMAWHSYCGCEMVSSLCITLTTCEGTAGPLKLLLRDQALHKLVEIDLAGPVDYDYSMTYTFDKPVAASSLGEAVLINETEDPATVTSLRLVGMDSCFNWTYIDHTCPGMVLGPGGCKRVVVYGG